METNSLPEIQEEELILSSVVSDSQRSDEEVTQKKDKKDKKNKKDRTPKTDRKKKDKKDKKAAKHNNDKKTQER